MRQRASRVPGTPFKGPAHGVTSDGLTCSELQCQGSSSKGVRDIGVGTELSGFGVRAAEAAFSQREVLAEGIVPLLMPLPTEPAGEHRI